MRLIKLTEVNGETVYVNAEQVVKIRPPIASIEPDAKSVIIVLTSGSCAVLENVEDVMKLLGASQ
jgi:uncharacterized protein YlzI (FlbEa/FlbD family)